MSGLNIRRNWSLLIKIREISKSGGAGSIVVPNDHNSAIVIPQEACSQVQDKIFVYIVTKDNKVKITSSIDANKNSVTSIRMTFFNPGG